MRKPYIVCAAVKLYDGVIICGARHFDKVMHSQIQAIFGDDETARRDQIRHSVQGFIDQYGKFYTREEAWDTAKKTGQVIDLERNTVGGQLFSEGLY